MSRPSSAVDYTSSAGGIPFREASGDAGRDGRPQAHGSAPLVSVSLAQRLQSIGFGMTVSVALHVILIAILSLFIIEPRVLDLSFVTDLLPHSPEAEEEQVEMPGDLSDLSDASAPVMDSQILQAADVLPASGLAGVPVVAGPPGLGIGPGAGAGGGGGDPDGTGLSPGFSAAAAGRLKKQAAAKAGDYEIALIWDGPSDLDLHVLVQSSTGKQREINFMHPGTPATGFLDVDQNADGTVTSLEPVEHIRWNTKSPTAGRYQVAVHGFDLRPMRGVYPDYVAFTVEIKTPDGVKSYTGKVAQDEFEPIDEFVVGLRKDQQQSIDLQADRLLATAKSQLDSGEERARSTAKGILRNILRRFPTSKAAHEARELLRLIP